MTGFIRIYLFSMVLWLPTSISVAAVEQDNSKKELPPAQQDAEQSGQVEFDRVCKVCHGPEARGDAGPRLVPFTREYEELLGIVREGAGQMPPISARELPDEGVAQIVAYLKSLSQER